jgi:hypothetical protein
VKEGRSCKRLNETNEMKCKDRGKDTSVRLRFFSESSSMRSWDALASSTSCFSSSISCDLVFNSSSNFAIFSFLTVNIIHCLSPIVSLISFLCSTITSVFFLSLFLSPSLSPFPSLLPPSLSFPPSPLSFPHVSLTS